MGTISSIDELGVVLLGKTRGAVLALLLTRPDEAFHVRQVARLSGAALGAVQRELQSLSRVGVLLRSRSGNQVSFRANPACPVLAELTGLVLKTAAMTPLLRDALGPLSLAVRAAFVFGSFARGEPRQASDVDVIVVGDIKFTDVAAALAAPQRRLGRDVNPTVYRPTDFAARVARGDHFLTRVLAGPKLFLIGDEHELHRVAAERLAPAAPKRPAGGRAAPRGHRP